MHAIVEFEVANLKRALKDDHVRAGIKSLDKYGSMNTVDALAEGNIMNWKNVMQMSYEKVFVKLMMNKDVAQFQEKYYDLMKKK